MPARGLETRLPPDVRERLECRLIELGFSRYSELCDELNSWLAETDTAPVSRSTLHRFGAKFEGRVAALKRSTEMAQALAAEVGDDEGALNDALIRLVQQKVFEAVVDLQVDPEETDLKGLARVIRDLSKASVDQKRLQAEIRDKVAAKLSELETQARSGVKSTLDAETVRQIREAVYGVL